MVTQDFPPLRGGIHTYARELARRLARRHALTVVAPTMDGDVAFDRTATYQTVRVPGRGDLVSLNSLPVVLRGRWDVAEHSFRPPYFHRNAASEFIGIVSMPGGKGSKGFVPGCAFFTPNLTGHGVASSAVAHQYAMSDEEAARPLRGSDESLWVMFESILTLRVMPWMLGAEHEDRDFRSLFTATPVPYAGPDEGSA